MNLSTLSVMHAASLWYPIMLAQMANEISESKAAELLGTNLEVYRDKREAAIAAVLRLVNELPSPLTSLLEVIAETHALQK